MADPQMINAMQAMQLQLDQSTEQNTRLATALDLLRQESHTRIVTMQAEITAFRGIPSSEKIQLIDLKTYQPDTFGGTISELYKPWAKKAKAYCNAKCQGFRKAMEWAEARMMSIGSDPSSVLSQLNWEQAETADAKLYDFLCTITTGEALIIVEGTKDQGFDAWRLLHKRYAPTGGRHELERMTHLLHRKQCSSLAAVPAAADKLERDIRAYEDRGDVAFPEEWEIPLLLQMLPESHKKELEMKFTLGERKYEQMLANIVGFSNEYRFQTRRTRTTWMCRRYRQASRQRKRRFRI